MSKPPRGLTIKGCIKRLKGITISDLKKISTRDLNALIGLYQLLVPIQAELTERRFLINRPLKSCARDTGSKVGTAFDPALDTENASA